MFPTIRLDESEAQVLAAVKHFLALCKINGTLDYWRISSTGIPDGTGRMFRNKEQEGFSDLLILPRNQMPLFIEVKSTKGKQSDPQRKFQARVEQQGHKYYIVHSVDDLMSILKSYAVI